MVVAEISIPMSINPRTGKREYTETQLAILKPKWRRQWREYSDLDEDMIDILVDKIHTGPFEWPGTRISEGSSRGIRKFMKETAHEWRGKHPTGSQIYREAKKRLNAFARKTADAKEVEDPFAFEYFLTQKERKIKRRSIYDWE